MRATGGSSQPRPAGSGEGPGDVRTRSGTRPAAMRPATLPATRASRRRRRWPNRHVLAVAIPAIIYLVIGLSYSLLTPAYEANDEVAHVTYVQHVLTTHRPLPIADVPIEVGTAHESGQPPLYYVLAAGWQKLLGINAFHPTIRGVDPPPLTPPKLQLHHDYTAAERAAAVHLHQLRLVSVLFGLGTVVLAGVVGRLVTGRDDIAAATGLFVALLPKFDVVTATVQNDSLAIMLSALGLVGYLLWRRSAPSWRRSLLAAGLGVVLGLMALTKYTTLPLVVILLLLLAVEATRSRRLPGLADLALAVVAAGGVAGWWFLRNIEIYGDALAQRANSDYLSQAIPGLIEPVGWISRTRFLEFLPRVAFQTVWYDGGWNQFLLPFGLNAALFALASVAVFGAVRSFAVSAASRRLSNRRLVAPGDAASLVGACLAAVAAVVLIAKTTTQAEGRYTYVAITAFGLLCVLGLREAVGGSATVRRFATWVWPAVLAVLNAYVIAVFLLPFAGL